jgi:hypothetical protein
MMNLILVSSYQRIIQSQADEPRVSNGESENWRCGEPTGGTSDRLTMFEGYAAEYAIWWHKERVEIHFISPTAGKEGT